MSFESQHVRVEPLTFEDDETSLGFIFKPLDGGTLSAQGVLDALADYLIGTDPDSLRFQPPAGTH